MISTHVPVALRELPAHAYRAGAPVPRPAERRDALRLMSDVAELPALARALAPDGPRIRIEAAGRTGWPSPQEVALLVAGGVVELALRLPSTVGGGDWVHLVGLLVAAREHGLPVEWNLPAQPPAWATASVLRHLPPPAADDPRSWCDEHRYGQLFWRHGPGFALVIDARTDSRIRYVIDEPPLLELFHALSRPRPLDALPNDLLDELPELVDADLAVTGGGLAMRLPYRLRHWPMPGHQL